MREEAYREDEDGTNSGTLTIDNREEDQCLPPISSASSISKQTKKVARVNLPIQEDDMSDCPSGLFSDIGEGVQQVTSARSKCASVFQGTASVSSMANMVPWWMKQRPRRKDAQNSMGLPSRDSLRLSIDSEHIRGAKVSNIMERGGHHFKAGVQDFGPTELFNLSQRVLYINDFISHSWRDGRWPKFLALCLLYNAQVGFLASLVYSFGACALERNALLPTLFGSFRLRIAGKYYTLTEGSWAILGAPVVFVFVTYHWQNMRELIGKLPRIAFLDRLCIHQTDEELKVNGILSIGGILQHSQRMVVLWSPDYFFRLWCMFEVAVWCHLGRFNELVFLPLSKSAVVPAVAIWAYMVHIMAKVQQSQRTDFSVQDMLRGGHGQMLFTWGTMFVFSCIVVVFVAALALGHILRRTMRSLLSLKAQLEDVSVLEAECFCCSVKHVHPDTKVRMPCDRALVMNTIKELFPGADPASEFDSKLRTDFARRIVASVGGPDAMPFRWCLLMLMSSVWRICDVGVADVPYSIMIRLILAHFIGFLESILATKLMLYLSCRFARQLESPLLDVLASFAVTSVVFLFLVLLAGKTMKIQQLELLWPLVVNVVVGIVIILGVFWCDFPQVVVEGRESIRRGGSLLLGDKFAAVVPT